MHRQGQAAHGQALQGRALLLMWAGFLYLAVVLDAFPTQESLSRNSVAHEPKNESLNSARMY
jgi:hypothetical protein